jgi:hypothetical protein
MTRISSALCTSLALSFAAASASPVAAAPVFIPAVPEAGVRAESVQYRKMQRNRFERRGGIAYLNGRRGYRSWRRGYREHNGFWFPAGAFITGLIIGGALNDRPVVRSGSAHVRWCENRWRSYDAYSDTYQPNYGPRRVCVSPYS